MRSEGSRFAWVSEYKQEYPRKDEVRRLGEGAVERADLLPILMI